MKNLLAKLKTTLEPRYKTVVAALGAVLGLLYQIEATTPNHYVEAAIALLLVLGVHQTANKV